MRRPSITLSPSAPPAEPAYPEYREVREEAERSSSGPMDPRAPYRMEEVARRRGGAWCSAVLGRPYTGIRAISTTDAWMLLVADERGLNPPLPARMIAEREAQQAAQTERDVLAEERRDREQQRWAAVVGVVPAPLTVRENTRHSGIGGPLRHAVPAVELRSGRARRHLPDRALCESAGRANPLRLGDPVDAPANCRSCLRYTGLVRLAGTAQPPTAGERTLLELVAAGHVFTLRPARSQPEVRDTSQRSRGTRHGALGRKVDAAVERLRAKGWVQVDVEYSATQTGSHGQRWRLTDSGTAALES